MKSIKALVAGTTLAVGLAAFAGASNASAQTAYTVQSGDTLAKISQKYVGDFSLVNSIASANGIANPNMIYVGERLTIPSKGQAVTKTSQATTTYSAPKTQTTYKAQSTYKKPAYNTQKSYSTNTAAKKSYTQKATYKNQLLNHTNVQLQHQQVLTQLKSGSQTKNQVVHTQHVAQLVNTSVATN